MFGYLTAPVRLTEEQELSPGRAWQVWQRQIEKIGQALRTGYGLCRVLRQLYVLWTRFGQKDMRPTRPTSFGRLQQETCGVAHGALSRRDPEAERRTQQRRAA